MTLHIGILLFPQNTQLDLTGPFELLHRLPDSAVHLVWKDTAPVQAASGLRIVPTTTLSDCPPLDVLLVPGGIGTADLLTDAPVLEWVAAQGSRARYVTAVCTGSQAITARADALDPTPRSKGKSQVPRPPRTAKKSTPHVTAVAASEMRIIELTPPP